MRGKRALVVDDNDLSRELLSAMFSRKNVETTAIRDATSALSVLGESTFDVVLVDLRLPDMPGALLIRSIRENPATAHLPVVVVSGATTEEDREKCRQEGCSGFLSKPFSYEDFQSVLGPFLNGVS
jgi:CheY-like chemotaxis protein